MATKTTEWRPGPTVCRCCLAEGCYKDISTEYFWMGKREVYAEMLANTFDLSIAYSQSGGPYSNSRLICEPCISRLRDAADFKRQVVECEKTFLQHLDPSCSADTVVNVSAVVPLEDDREVKIEGVKVERLGSEDELDDSANFNNDDDDDDDLDDQPLTKLASKCSKKDSVDLLDIIDNAKVADKRKSTVKVKATPVKKVKMKKEAKATASKAKPEKKKKGTEESNASDTPKQKVKVQWRRKRKPAGDKANAAVILQHSNAVAFRWNRGKFMCAYCPHIFPSIKELRSHSMDHTNKLEVFENLKVRNSFPLRVDIADLECNICNKKSGSLEKLKTHLTDQHEKTFESNHEDGLIPFILGDEHKCVKCSSRFESFMSLLVHMNRHYSTCICHVCGKAYSGKHKLKSHQRGHDLGKFECTKCKRVLVSRAAWSGHVSSAHGRRERYRCPLCDEHFLSYHSRLRHLDQHHGRKAEYRCTMCTSVFGSGALRNCHLKIAHRVKKIM
ncbi:zinc finger and BTB domain-containing protein 24-like isoform X13 [Battus philenor]|uniref:zinc finger and BTB domain-containing protein 24-like isoform X13 n=1 Tax=Battus philenor TaxID=42288 RepID=UPI0035D0D7D2